MDAVPVLLLVLAGPVLLVALAVAVSAALPGTRPPLRARPPHELRRPAGPAGGGAPPVRVVLPAAPAEERSPRRAPALRP